MNTPAYRLDGRPATREQFYAVACDARRHVVVQACAGAGKTWMLVSRIVRALLDGAQPQEILAITFTRKAAGEMRTRLAQWLAAFAQLDEATAAAELRERGVAAADAPRQAAALVALHEQLLMHGRAVEVRTFHAWFSQLLQAAPLELLASLGLAPGLALIEDSSDLEPELMHAFHAAVRGDATLLADYQMLAVRHGRAMLTRWLREALARRAEIELADAAGTLEPAVEPGSARHPAARVREAAFVMRAHALARALTARGKTTSDEAAQGLLDALALPDDRQAFAALRSALFTDKGSGTPRKRLGDLPLQAEVCAELDALANAAAQFEAHEDHAAMVRLSRVLFAAFASLKQRRGLVDMPDLERVALALLADHTLAGWVQQRLDARVRHLLIDEFQDTSPLQWHALHAWLSAYAGAGGGAQGPRLFIVGDPKQSIYRFRRAEPRVFEAAQRFVVEALEGTLAACDHTRRCAPGVLGVVNAVFGPLHDDGTLPDWRAHTTEVVADAAAVPALRALPTAERVRVRRERDDAQVTRSWRASLIEPRHEPDVALREAEAEAVAQAIEALVRGQGMAPGRIMVLARKRDPLRWLADALAARQLPFVAPEDTLLRELPEAQDLLAVLDVLASPTQSLSLARALKSPLFGASDEDLLALAGRALDADGWWSALLPCADDGSAPPSLRRAARLLVRWRDAAGTLPPHDLLDRIVHEGELMPRLLAAVPAAVRARAQDAVRALLATALTLDGARFATPYNFVRALRRRRIEAPRAAHPDAVQLLTIHGAKGLEAQVVFLMDAEPEARKGERAGVLVEWPVDAARPSRVAFLAAESRCPPTLRGLMAEEHAAREREEVNALYVALTRAQAALVVSRTPPHAPGTATSWWHCLQPHALAWTPEAPAPVACAAGEIEVIDWPAAAVADVLAEPSAAEAEDTDAARLGRAVHRWLEWASADPAADRALLADAAAQACGVADASEVGTIGARILANPACRRFFEHAAIAWAGNEVPVASVEGEPRRIDRLVRLAGPVPEWWVLDYKLTASPQGDPALRAQLAAYRDAVARLAPGEPVRAAFVTGQGELVELPA